MILQLLRVQGLLRPRLDITNSAKTHELDTLSLNSQHRQSRHYNSCQSPVVTITNLGLSFNVNPVLNTFLDP